MDKQHFDQLVKGVREMKRHIEGVRAGKSVRGARTTELPAPDVRTIREAAKISQSQFAKLIGVNLRTPQYWEHNARSPPAPSGRRSRSLLQTRRRLRRCKGKPGLSHGRGESYARKRFQTWVSGRSPSVVHGTKRDLSSIALSNRREANAK